MSTLAERMNKETSNKGISEALFLGTIKKLETMIVNQNEALKVLIATIGNEAKTREDRINTLLAANERILINNAKELLHGNTRTNDNKEILCNNTGNANKQVITGNGIDTKVSVSDNGFTFNMDKFKSVYPYRIHDTFLPAMEAFKASLTSRINGYEAFQTVYESFIKSSKDYDIRKLVPGIMKVTFWNSMKQALSFHKVSDIPKPTKQTLTSETKGIDKNDLVTLTGILDTVGIEKETLINTINKVKPLLSKEDFDKQGFISEDLFQEISSMLGFNIDNRAMVSKVKIHISRLLA